VRAGGKWEVEITDRPLLVATLGEPLVVAFCRCFVHGDRLAALSSLVVGTIGDTRRLSVATKRNLDTIFWYSTGTLLELQKALADLARELHAAGLTTVRLKGWPVLRELSSWSQSKLLRHLRNKIAFHVDTAEIRAGLRAPVPAGEPWLLAHGDDVSMHDAHVPFGTHPLLVGLQIRRQDMGPLIKGVVERQRRIPLALHDAFLTVLRRKGLLIEGARGRRTRR
jgi:hypothetical protein